MCGIAGIWGELANTESLVEKMCRSLAHRGPDSNGLWHDSNNSLCMGHRRLAILGLDGSGYQPKTSVSGRYVVAYNGEIYNHTALRNQLDQDWQGHSDTETLLAGFDKWGFKETLHHLDGMFAVCAWDRLERKLYLARDPFGEKPLCYGRISANFVFASEIKAIDDVFSKYLTINPESVSLLLSNNSIPAPESIYKELGKIKPAHYVEISDSGRLMGDQISYWSIENISKQVPSSDAKKQSAKSAVESTRSVLKRVVPTRLISDRPVGAFLSGGVDSSLVTALLQESTNHNLKTFSIGFEADSMNEAPFAKAIASHLGTDHTEFYVSDDDAVTTVEKLNEICDEPFADSSQIPTYLLSKLTKSQVTVAISGDGGDELFGGYQRYQEATRIWSFLSRIPYPVRYLGAGVNTRLLDLLKALESKKPEIAMNVIARKIRHQGVLARLTSSKTFEEFYSNLVSVDCSDYAPTILGPAHRSRSHDMTHLQYMMNQDLHTYLPNTILTKVDKASMAVSLETRAPLLSKELAEVAWSLPDDYRIINGEGKWILRQVLHDYVPRKLIDRPKKGFSVPLSEWLAGPLKQWAEQLLSKEELSKHGYLDVSCIRAMWYQQKSGHWDWSKQLWSVLMFQAWYLGKR